MAREVCFFDKFSYCKNGDSCGRLHLKEVCLVRGCDYRKCEKRHPNPCKTFMLKGFCRFGKSCKYSHRLSKEAEEQNKKIESLEEVTKQLSNSISIQRQLNVWEKLNVKFQFEAFPVIVPINSWGAAVWGGNKIYTISTQFIVCKKVMLINVGNSWNASN